MDDDRDPSVEAPDQTASALPSRPQFGRTADEDLQLWLHFAAFGGEDKNRMVTVTSWLLGFSSALLWYVISRLLGGGGLRLEEPGRALVTAGLGIVISATAGYVALLYGGYSNQNWHRADAIAEVRGWHDLLPDHPLPAVTGILNRRAFAWSRPCVPDTALAPIFRVFFALSGVVLVAHVFVLFSAAVVL